VTKPKASFYLYIRAPKATADGRQFASAEDFCQYLITEKLISSLPGTTPAPTSGFSVTFEAADEQEERRIVAEIKRRRSDVQFIF